MMHQRLRIAIILIFTVCLSSVWQVEAQTTPEIGGNYYIAAQTWDGNKYVERLLYLSGNNILQTTDISRASRFDALTPANGSGIGLRTGGKFLMRGGISSASWGSIIEEATLTMSEPPGGSMTLLSTVRGYNYYIIAPNAGTGFDATNAATEASYQPKSSLYTPYFRFYPTNTPIITVSEVLGDGTPTAIGANYILTPTHGNPQAGNLWTATDGEITVEHGSYNDVFYTFEGFRVGNNPDLVPSVNIGGLTENTSIKAVFATNSLQDEVFTIISTYPAWYANQSVYKAIYLDTADNMLKWKTYDPADDAFYFKAHGTYDNLTLESMAAPGQYITGATTATAATGAEIQLVALGAGDYNIIAGGETLSAGAHNSGRNAQGSLTSAAGTAGSVSAWQIQSANDAVAEQARYDSALADEALKASENQRQSARLDLLNAIKRVTVGEAMGNVPQDAYELAYETYSNPTLSVADYNNAVTLLYSACRVPAIGTIWRIINSGNAGQVVCVGKDDALLRTTNKLSLYQMWEVVDINPENPTQLAFQNIGSGTYMHCATTSSNSPTITTDTPAYVNLNAITPGIFSIEVLGRADNYIYFSTSPYGPAVIVNTAGSWRFEEVSDEELTTLSVQEYDRQSTRDELLALIDDINTLSTQLGGIGYYTDLTQAVATAKTVYDDATRMINEYQADIEALQDAVRSASYLAPDDQALYIICDTDGHIAMKHDADKATLTTYDDTQSAHFWTLTAAPASSETLLPWTQRYTLSSVGGDNHLNITLQLIGNDQYHISIDGDDDWNAENAQLPLSIHKATIGTDMCYLDDGEVYRIRNAATGQVITRSEQWTSRVAMDEADASNTDWNQLWRIVKQVGADRYTLHNVESERTIQEALRADTQLQATFTPGTWHLQAGSEAGQYKLLTTMAPTEQLAIAPNGDKAVVAAQDAEATLWVFEKVSPAERQTVKHQVVKILSRYESERAPGHEDYLYANLQRVSHSYVAAGEMTDDYKQWIIIERDSVSADGTKVLDANGDPIRLAALRSSYSALYLNPPSTMGPTPFYFQLVTYTEPGNDKEYTLFKDPAAEQYLTPRTNMDQLIYYPTKTHQYPHWTIQPIEDMALTDNDLLDRADNLYGFTVPEDGAVMRIYTSYGNTCLDDYYKTNVLQHKGYDPKRYGQLWRLHRDQVSGHYKLENIYTGNYMVNSASAGANVATTADPSCAGEFAIALNKKVTSSRQYNILDTRTGLALNAQNTNINNASPTAIDLVTPTEFRFSLDTSTDEQYLAMREKFEENNNLVGNNSKYDKILAQIFEDKAYTQLRSDLTDEQIADAIDDLPELLSDMVTKIKDDSWPTGASGTCWEKMFRIREYPVTSSSAFSGVIKVSYNFSTLNEPIGVMAHPGDIVAIMVEDEPKAGSTLRLEMIEGLNRSGSQVTLKQGLNLVQVSEESNLFVYYQITSTQDNPDYYLANFPDIKIHVEGGEVYGCINRVHGPGITVEEANDLWVRMQADGLITNGTMSTVVGESIALNFNSKSMIEGCPERIGEVIDIWDSWIKIQQWIMGLRDHDGNIINDYIPNLKERWNNRWLAYERTGGYMNANGGGAQYNTSTVATIVNFDVLKTGNGAWGPVHEHGHDHQTLINMCGMTEVSNNLFSNVNTYEFGAIVSRGTSLPDAGDVYARGGNWFDNNIWTMTQMYYKLYLYYHVAGHKPTFYPELFAKLRKEPFMHNASVAVPADRDYLQFARFCSVVAGEDLSEFFEAYGMLRPLTPEYSLSGASAFEDFKGQNCRIVGDYSTYHVYTTDEMIAEAKAAMAACGPKNGNIMFIDDRVSRQPATHPWAEPGQMRADRGDGGRVGAYGDVGMWSDFSAEGCRRYAHDYTLEHESTSRGMVLHIEGEGAIGYKVYGPEGELVYFSAFNDILLPAAVLEKYDLDDLTVAVAQADGTSVELSSADKQLYTMTTYRDGSSEGISMPVTGRMEPELKGNDVCVIEPLEGVDAAGYRYASTANVIVKMADDTHHMSKLQLTDGVNFIMPVDATYDEATYSRQDTEGWNSVCLPFATTADDFGAGAVIYTAHSLREIDGDYALVLESVDSLAPGEPGFVWCAEETAAWDMHKTAGMASSAITTTASRDETLLSVGTYTDAEPTDGLYVLDRGQEEFILMSSPESGWATAFRSQIKPVGLATAPDRARISTDTTPAYILGDANGDGEVSVTDIVWIVDYIMEAADSVFVFDAADINADGNITVSDIVDLVDIILTAE